jgi:CCR4-NOT transcription complex subunit 1
MQKFRSSDLKKEQEIYACMLHSLFDEYRFLHKYPTQYLEKIAKLYGAIIKNRIIDGTLQEIALKFVVEAFRREGKRMKFGVIVVRQIIDLLPQFPQFFEGIHEMRHNFQS